MQRTSILGAVFLLLVASHGAGGPINGGFFQIKELGSEPLKLSQRFRGGERAAVLVRGQKPAAVKLHVKVFDSKDQLVAEDIGKDPPVAGMVAVFWYPPRDAEFRIEIRNLAAPLECYITIK